MELTKLMTFFCLISLYRCNGQDLRNDASIKSLPLETVPTIENPKYGYFRRVNTLTNNFRQCFCFLQKQTSLPVVQKLNPIGGNLERLVVYLYRDPYSADIKLYLPNNEKQIMIPDLAFDEGDRFELISAKTIESLFTKHSELVTDRKEIIAPDIAHIIRPEKLFENMKKPSFNFNIVKDFNLPLNKIPEQFNKIIDDDTNQNDLSFKPGPFNSISKEIIKQTELNIITNDETKMLNVNTEPGNSNIPSVYVNDEQNFNLNENVIEVNDNLSNKKIKEIIKYEGPKITESEQNTYGNNMIWSVLTDNDVSTVNSPVKYNSQITQLILNDKFKQPLITLNNDNKVNENMKISTQKQLQYFEDKLINNKPMNPHNLPVITLHPQKLIKKYLEQNEHKANDGDFRDTFDTWFNQQLKRIQFDDSEASNSIDIYTFKYLVENTLYDNGIFITEKGLLSDSNGNILKTANLNLRPILIGNTVDYKNLLQGKLTTFKLPTDLPYLEAVMITSSNPPKILGMIPLGTMRLPKSHGNPLSMHVENYSDQVTPGCGRACNIWKFLLPRHQLRNNIETHKGHHGLYRPTSEKLLQHESYSQILPNRKPYFNKLLFTKRPFLKYNNKPAPTTGNIKYPVRVADEKPGFRIIGGNAATSSGTPVNSKGRSGQASSENSLEYSEDSDDIEI